MPSDIHEHLPVLRYLASSATTVVELGMRTGVSTVALAHGLWPRGSLVSIDINPEAVHATFDRFREQIHPRGADAARVSWKSPGPDRRAYLAAGDYWGVALLCEDSLQASVIPCDLLFIDSLHTAKQLESELQRWSPAVKHVIALHDTVTFGSHGEDGRSPGLMGAVRHWLRVGNGQGRWRVGRHYLNNNGLLVLERHR